MAGPFKVTPGIETDLLGKTAAREAIERANQPANDLGNIQVISAEEARAMIAILAQEPEDVRAAALQQLAAWAANPVVFQVTFDADGLAVMRSYIDGLKKAQLNEGWSKVPVLSPQDARPTPALRGYKLQAFIAGLAAKVLTDGNDPRNDLKGGEVMVLGKDEADAIIEALEKALPASGATLKLTLAELDEWVRGGARFGLALTPEARTELLNESEKLGQRLSWLPNP